MARERGLEPLAEILFRQETERSMEEEALPYINEEKGVKTAADAIAGAMDIIAENIAEQAEFRNGIRKVTMREGNLISRAKEEKAE